MGAKGAEQVVRPLIPRDVLCEARVDQVQFLAPDTPVELPLPGSLQASVPSFKSIQILEDGTIELVVFQNPQIPVSLEWSPNLYEWFQFFQAPSGTNTFRAIDTNALDSARFYRVHPSP